MKNSILIVGMALALSSNVCNAKNTVSIPFNLSKDNFMSDTKIEKKSNEGAKFEKPHLVEDVEIFNPETVIAYHPKTEKEIIAEGDKIIDYTVSDDAEFMIYEESMRKIITQADLIIENSISNETRPIYIERTLEDKIAELELIIESTETNEISPLDFQKINSNSIKNNYFNTEKFLGMN